DSGCLLFPLLPERLHSGLRRLTQWVRTGHIASGITASAKPLSIDPANLRLVEMERWSTEQVLLDSTTPGHKPGLPGWEVLRVNGGEINEVMALAAGEEAKPEEPLVVAGRFVDGGLFQTTLLPYQPEGRCRLSVHTAAGRAELLFSNGWPGPATLSWLDES